MKDCLPKEGHEDPGKEQLFLATLPGEQLLPWDVGLWQRGWFKLRSHSPLPGRWAQTIQAEPQPHSALGHGVLGSSSY
jgi:hypothetical protein